MLWKYRPPGLLLLLFIFSGSLLGTVFPLTVEQSDNTVRIIVNASGDILNSISDPRYRQGLTLAVRDIEVCGNGDILAATWGNGVFLLNQRLELIRRYFTSEAVNSLELRDNITPGPGFVAGCRGSICISDRDSSRIIDTRQYSQGGIYHDLCLQHRYGMIAGSTGKGLYIFSEDGKLLKIISQPLSNLWINTLHPDPPAWFLQKNLIFKESDYLLIGGTKGLELYDMKNNATFPVVQVRGSVNKVRFFDHKAVISTTENGVYLFYYNRWLHFCRESAIQGENIFDATISGSKIFVATGNGLYTIDYVSDDPLKKAVPGFQDEVRTVCSSGEDIIVGTKNGLVVKFSFKNDTIQNETKIKIGDLL